MGFDETDPTARRRWEPEAQRERDAEILRLYRAGVPQRGIAERLGVSLGSVQHVIRREQKLSAALATGEPAGIVAVVTDDVAAEDLTPEELADPDCWRQLSPLERYRYAHVPGGRPVPLHDDDHQLCCYAHGLDPTWTPYEHAVSWRAGVEAARPGATGPADDDDW